MPSIRNVVSFDVEDYFQVGAFEERVSISEWDGFPSRVEANTDKILRMMDDTHCVGTFFVLGWVAEKFPALVRRIAEQGHEVGCHSHLHRRVFRLTPESFRADTQMAKAVIENAIGGPIYGYRAPNFSITDRSLWALDILAELGFQYDSSIFPVKHPNYGMPRVSRFPFRVQTASGTLVEFPLTTIAIGQQRSPMSGGAYLRLLPYSYIQWGLGYLNRVEGQPFCVYLHPWELDPEQPHISASFSARLRHRLGLRSTEKKFAKLLRRFTYTTMRELTLGLQNDALGSMETIPISALGVASLS